MPLLTVMLTSIALASAAGKAATPAPRGGVCDVTAHGARGDGKTLDTAAIQRAIDACAARGGGTVLLPTGTFLSGTIVLADDITLRVSAGATLLASPRIDTNTSSQVGDASAKCGPSDNSLCGSAGAHTSRERGTYRDPSPDIRGTVSRRRWAAFR